MTIYSSACAQHDRKSQIEISRQASIPQLLPLFSFFFFKSSSDLPLFGFSLSFFFPLLFPPSHSDYSSPYGVYWHGLLQNMPENHPWHSCISSNQQLAPANKYPHHHGCWNISSCPRISIIIVVVIITIIIMIHHLSILCKLLTNNHNHDIPPIIKLQGLLFTYSIS